MRQIIRLVLLGLFTFLVVTVAAFRYLEWWQAILASAATFLLLIYGAKLLIKTAIGRMGEFAAGMFRTKSQVLRNATVDVHSVKPADPPRELVEAAGKDPADYDPEADDCGYDPEAAKAELRRNRWYVIDVSIHPGPAAAGPMKHWDLDDLQLVPSDVEVSEKDLGAAAEVEEFAPSQVELYSEGEFLSPDGPKVRGPQRLRLTVAIPKTVDEVKFRYYFEAFGLVKLPAPPLLGPAKRGADFD
jgi:hypothetical protein